MVELVGDRATAVLVMMVVQQVQPVPACVDQSAASLSVPMPVAATGSSALPLHACAS
jgi:hypothetical protein